LQEGDEWLEEGEGGDIGTQHLASNESQGEKSSPPASASTSSQDQSPPELTETPTVAASTTNPPAPATPAPTKAAKDPSPPETLSSAPAPQGADASTVGSKARPSKAKAASTAMSNFFSLDAMQVRRTSQDYNHLLYSSSNGLCQYIYDIISTSNKPCGLRQRTGRRPVDEERPNRERALRFYTNEQRFSRRWRV
jgi:hypothetical protein